MNKAFCICEHDTGQCKARNVDWTEDFNHKKAYSFFESVIIQKSLR